MANKLSKPLLTELAVFGLKLFAPLTTVVFVERMMGPGSDAKASQIMVGLLIANLLLGAASFFNLIKTTPGIKSKKFAITESILWAAKMLAPVCMVVVIEQMMGPGSTARTAQLSPYLLCINFVLGMVSLVNLQFAMKSSAQSQAENKDPNAAVQPV